MSQRDPMRFVLVEARQSRGVRTAGLARAGQAEIYLALPPDAGSQFEACAITILSHIAHYVRQEGRRIVAGETMAGPWSRLRFVHLDTSASPGDPPCLALQEMADVYGDLDRGYVNGAQATMRIMLAQDGAVERIGVPADLLIARPHCDELAIVCRRLLEDPAGAHLVQMERLETAQASDSGWCVGCRDQDHDHDDSANLVAVHLKHAVERYPIILQYLAMPTGTALTFDAQMAVVFLPGKDEGIPDPGMLFSWRS